MTVSRRNFLRLAASAAVLPAAAHFARAQVFSTTSQRVRVATGLLATWQSTAWLGAEAGLFKKRGIDMTLPAIAVGGPEAAAGLIRGDWEFAHTGTVPVAEEVLKGGDTVILATPTSVFPMTFVMARKEITQLAQLGGKKVGVLTENWADQRGDPDHDRESGRYRGLPPPATLARRRSNGALGVKVSLCGFVVYRGEIA